MRYQGTHETTEAPTIHRRMSLGSTRWAWCSSDITDHLSGAQKNVTCPRCIEAVETFRAQRALR